MIDRNPCLRSGWSARRGGCCEGLCGLLIGAVSDRYRCLQACCWQRSFSRLAYNFNLPLACGMGNCNRLAEVRIVWSGPVLCGAASVLRREQERFRLRILSCLLLQPADLIFSLLLVVCAYIEAGNLPCWDLRSRLLPVPDSSLVLLLLKDFPNLQRRNAIDGQHGPGLCQGAGPGFARSGILNLRAGCVVSLLQDVLNRSESK